MSYPKFTTIFVLLSCAPQIHGDVVVNDGFRGEVHLIFTTSSTMGGSLGGASGADSIVGSFADAGSATSGKPLTWVALLSDSTRNANSLISDSHPIYNTNGDRVADDFASLFSATLNNLDFDENGTQIANHTRVRAWTGSDRFGNATANDCLDWTVATAGAETGSFGSSILATENRHIEEFIDLSTLCNAQLTLYGISSNTVTAIPEPNSFLYLGVVGLFVVGRGWCDRRTAIYGNASTS